MTEIPVNQTTITEALAEIKTITSRLQKKRESIMPYVIRDGRMRDPLERSGGSPDFIKKERQSIADLEKRIVLLRTEIQKANLSKTLTVLGETRTVSEWLTWRRELATPQKLFVTGIAYHLNNVRQQSNRNNARVMAAAAASASVQTSTDIPDYVVNVDEKEVISEVERIEQQLGELDGKLSLFNATALIQV